MEFDGKKQRNALTAAERSIQALGRGDTEGARRAIGRAQDLDQLGLYEDLGVAVTQVAEVLETEGTLDPVAWDVIKAAVGPGPLAALVDSVRA